MATDWLKIEVNLPDKPEVLALAAEMKWPDPDLAVGKLIRLWRWFDQHTRNGYAPGVTKFMIDEICGCEEIAKALVNIGWLRISSHGATLPHFDLHNGNTAKQRALSARRMMALRQRQRNGSVTEAQPEGEGEGESPLKSKSNTQGGRVHTAVKAPPPRNPSSRSQFTQADFDERDMRKIATARKALDARMGARVGSNVEMTNGEYYGVVSEQTGIPVKRILELIEKQKQWPQPEENHGTE